MSYVFIPIAISLLGVAFALGRLAQSASVRSSIYLTIGRRAGYKHAASLVKECTSVEEAHKAVHEQYLATLKVQDND